MSMYSSVVISPATTTSPVVISVSHATRLMGSFVKRGIEDRVGDLVRDLVGMPFGDRLGSEEEGALSHVRRVAP